MSKGHAVSDRARVVLIKGAGDLGSGVAYRLRRCGFAVAMTELAQPFCVRRAVCFAEAAYAGETDIEGVRARRATTLAETLAILAAGAIPILIMPAPDLLHALKPTIVVDAIMAKQNTGTHLTEAPLVIALSLIHI